MVQCQNERLPAPRIATRRGSKLRARLYEFELEKKRRWKTRKTEDSKLEINFFGSQTSAITYWAPYIAWVKDLRSKLALGDVDRVLEGDLEPLIHAFLVWRKTGRVAGDSQDELPE